METERPDAPWLCLVCGLNLEGLDEPPWGESGVDPSYNFCPCCGVEFGYGDASFEGVRRWRSRWTAAGSQWFDPSVRPEQWELGPQLEALPWQTDLVARNSVNASPVILGVLASCAMVVIAAFLVGVGIYLMVGEIPEPPRTDKVASGWKYVPFALAVVAVLGSVPVGVLVARSARKVFDRDTAV